MNSPPWKYDPALVGRRINELRLARRMKKKALAAALKRSPSAVTGLIKGKELTPELLGKLAEIFGVSEGHLLGKETGEPIYTEEECLARDSLDKIMKSQDSEVKDRVTRLLQILAARLKRR